MRGGERKSGPRREMSAAVRRAAGEILWLEGWGNLLEGEGKPFRGNAPCWGTVEGDWKRAELSGCRQEPREEKRREEWTWEREGELATRLKFPSLTKIRMSHSALLHYFTI